MHRERAGKRTTINILGYLMAILTHTGGLSICMITRHWQACKSYWLSSQMCALSANFLNGTHNEMGRVFLTGTKREHGENAQRACILPKEWSQVWSMSWTVNQNKVNLSLSARIWLDGISGRSCWFNTGQGRWIQTLPHGKCSWEQSQVYWVANNPLNWAGSRS